MPYKIKVPPKPVESGEAVALHWLDRWVAWETKHRRMLWPTIGTVVVLVFTTTGGWGWWWWQNRQATMLAGQAAQHYPALTPAMATTSPEQQTPTVAERCTKALSLYQQISSSYRRSRLAPLALYYQANCQAELGHADEAIALYQRVISDYSPDKEAVFFAAARLGALYAVQGNRSAAIEQFQWLTQRAEAPNRDQAYFELGRLLEADGNREAALNAYQSVSKDFSKSPWATEATVRIKQLGGGASAAPGG